MPSRRKLPFESTVRAGLKALNVRRPKSSVPALLVSIGAPRLRALGYPVRRPFRNPEHKLYEFLSRRKPGKPAYSMYNSLIRRLVSFERAASCVKRRT